jgi:hypothetical protein
MMDSFTAVGDCSPADNTEAKVNGGRKSDLFGNTRCGRELSLDQGNIRGPVSAGWINVKLHSIGWDEGG